MRAGRALGRRSTPSLAVAIVVSGVIAGCDGGRSSLPQPASSPAGPVGAVTTAPAIGTGTLTVSVTDIEGLPLANTSVSVNNRTQTASVGRGVTDTNGLVTIGSVPASVRVHIHHAFGRPFTSTVDVAQDAATFLPVTLEASRPRPTAALLPASIAPGSLSADRTELALELTVVASTDSPFVLAGYAAAPLSPSLGLDFGQSELLGGRDCFVWLERAKPVPTCGSWSGTGPYTVSVAELRYDPVGRAPLYSADEPAKSAMLVLDQSARVAVLDPQGRRSFAARRFIERETALSRVKSLSLAGFAGRQGDAPTPASLLELPLYLPAPAGPVFSTDQPSLLAGTRILEPLTGGSAPVFDAMQAALAVTAAHAPPGNSAVVALLGGGDDGGLSEAARRQALAALRRQRADTGVQAVLILGAPDAQRDERRALAELSAALHAPAVVLGVHSDSNDFYARTWTAGSFAALDLAADLLDGLPLPTLSAVFRLKGAEPFVAGTLLYGVVYVESDICPMGCAEFPLDFAVEIP